MPAKKDPVPAPPEEDEPQEFRFRVTSDNFVLDGKDGQRGKVVTRKADEATAALVYGGHLEPMSKGAAEATTVEP